MPEFRLPYGRTHLTAHLDGGFKVELLAPAHVPPASDSLQAVRLALENPLGGVRLDDFSRARSVAIAINDKTRPVPHSILLPPLLQKLDRIGIPRSAITFLIATGLHHPMQ